MAHGSGHPLLSETTWQLLKGGPRARSGDYTQRPPVLEKAGRIWREKSRASRTGWVGAAGAARATPYNSARHEADLPAKEAQARPRARFPCPHGLTRGAPDAEAPPHQGAQAPLHLTVVVARSPTPVD